MTKKKNALAAVCVIVVQATAAQAEAPLWKQVGPWGVYIDSSVKNGCFMFATYGQDTALRFGFNRENSNGYIWIADKKWQSLVPGNKYQISLQFGSATPWNGGAVALDLGDGLKALQLQFGDAKLLDELAAAQALSIQYNGAQIELLNLPRSGAAVAELVRCQNAADRLPATSSNDPFANHSAPPSDPFAK